MAATASTAATQLSRRHLKPWMVTAGGAPLGLLGGSRDEHHGPGMHGLWSGKANAAEPLTALANRQMGRQPLKGGEAGTSENLTCRAFG